VATEYAVPLDQDEAHLLLSTMCLAAAACEWYGKVSFKSINWSVLITYSFSTVPLFVSIERSPALNADKSFLEVAWQSTLPRYVGRVGARSVGCDFEVTSTTTQVFFICLFVLLSGHICVDFIFIIWFFAKRAFQATPMVRTLNNLQGLQDYFIDQVVLIVILNFSSRFDLIELLLSQAQSLPVSADADAQSRIRPFSSVVFQYQYRPPGLFAFGFEFKLVHC
jgi:hypothetical protein